MGDSVQMHEKEENVMFIDFVGSDGTPVQTQHSPRSSLKKKVSISTGPTTYIPESWHLEGNLKNDPIA